MIDEKTLSPTMQAALDAVGPKPSNTTMSERDIKLIQWLATSLAWNAQNLAAIVRGESVPVKEVAAAVEDAICAVERVKAVLQ